MINWVDNKNKPCKELKADISVTDEGLTLTLTKG